MTDRSMNRAASRAALAAALAGGLWALSAPGGALAGPGMEEHHHQSQSQPQSQHQGGGCGSGCGGGEGHHHGPSHEEIHNARESAERGAAGDDELGGTITIRSGGRPGEDLSGQIGATAAAQAGGGGSDDPSAALTNFASAEEDRRLLAESKARASEAEHKLEVQRTQLADWNRTANPDNRGPSYAQSSLKSGQLVPLDGFGTLMILSKTAAADADASTKQAVPQPAPALAKAADDGSSFIDDVQKFGQEAKAEVAAKPAHISDQEWRRANHYRNTHPPDSSDVIPKAQPIPATVTEPVLPLAAKPSASDYDPGGRIGPGGVDGGGDAQ